MAKKIEKVVRVYPKPTGSEWTLELVVGRDNLYQTVLNGTTAWNMGRRIARNLGIKFSTKERD